MMTNADAEPPCLTAALAYERMGWCALPLCPGDHLGVGKRHFKECNSPGKVPFFPLTESTSWGDYKSRRSTPNEIQAWWRYSRNLNVGVALGPVSGLVAIDIDSEAGETMLTAIAGGVLPDTLEYTTGKGRRIMYALPPGVPFQTRSRSEEGAEALRFMGFGSQIVMPPSVHKNGNPYVWTSGRGPDDLPLAVAPPWLLQIGAKLDPQQRETPGDDEAIPTGGRNNYMTRLAGAMRRQGADYDTIMAALITLNASRCDPPLPEYELRTVARSVARYAPEPEPPRILFGGAAVTQGEELPPEVADPKCSADVAGIDDLKRAGAKTEWLWKGWIQRGVLTAFAAEGGTGKTRETMDLVRRVRHRLPWPDGEAMAEWSGETIALWVVGDNHHSEMVSLCDAFGTTDCVKINAHPADIYGGVSLELIDDLVALEKRIAVTKPMFVVIDTVGNTTDKNLSRQEDAKAYYQPLQVIARRQNVAILCLTHLNGAGKVLGRRVMEKVRQVWRMSAETVNDHTCRRRLEVIKSNNPYPKAMGVTMSDSGNEYDDSPPASPEDREKAEKGPSQSAKECGEWLRDVLADAPRKVVDIRRDAEKKGFSTRALYEARELIGACETTAKKLKWWGLTDDPPADEPTIKFRP